jgi:ribosome-associated heat shock protein Hsp15
VDSVRLDKWLWAARFYKTRALAVDAIDGGKVDVNGEGAKRAKAIRPGDRVRVRLGPYEHLVTVVTLSERRGPASEAAKLYEEDTAARARRLELAQAHKIAAQAFAHGEGKPSRREREATRRLRGKT